MAKRYILRSEIDRVKRKHPDFELQLDEATGDDGTKFPKKIIKLPAAEVLPDAVLSLSINNPVQAARMLLGEDFAHYAAAGGSSALLFQIIQENSNADSMGESGPSSDS